MSRWDCPPRMRQYGSGEACKQAQVKDAKLPSFEAGRTKALPQTQRPQGWLSPATFDARKGLDGWQASDKRNSLSND